MKVTEQTGDEITIKLTWTEAEMLQFELFSIDEANFFAGNLFGSADMRKRLQNKEVEMDFPMLEKAVIILDKYFDKHA